MTDRHRFAKSTAASLIVGAALLLVFCGAFVARGAGQSPPAATRSVWDGVYSAEQAARGWRDFQENCAHCHGDELQGTAEGKALKGDRFWTDWKESTVDYLFERISKSMPHSEDGSLAGTLSKQTYIDLVADILNENGFPAGQKELTPDSSVGVQIIRKEGPGELPPGTLTRIVGCLNKSSDGTWKLTKATAPVRTRAGAPATNPSAAAPNREYALKFVLTPLDKFAGHRMAVTGLLIGEGGKDGVNFSSSTSLSPTCE